jgi:hypothetical protein
MSENPIVRLTVADLLSNREVVASLKMAWYDSNPGSEAGHEEGGFIVRDSAGIIRVSRWPPGTTGEIIVPPHPDCRFDDQLILASFHTHPNTGHGYRQEPSTMDRWTIRDDQNLKDPEYLGEFVLSRNGVYLVNQRGMVTTIGTLEALLPGED